MGPDNENGRWQDEIDDLLAQRLAYEREWEREDHEAEDPRVPLSYREWWDQMSRSVADFVDEAGTVRELREMDPDIYPAEIGLRRMREVSAGIVNARWWPTDDQTDNLDGLRGDVGVIFSARVDFLASHKSDLEPDADITLEEYIGAWVAGSLEKLIRHFPKGPSRNKFHVPVMMAWTSTQPYGGSVHAPAGSPSVPMPRLPRDGTASRPGTPPADEPVAQPTR